MSGVRRAARWVVLDGPCGLYLAGERTGGRVPWWFFVTMFGAAGAGAGIGALLAAVAGHHVAAGFDAGLTVGVSVVVGWTVYSLGVIGVLWVAGRSPDEVLLGGSAAVARGRHGSLGQSGWRRRGRDRLVPASLPAFFLLMALGALGFGLWDRHVEGPYRGDKAVADAEVVGYDDGRLGLGTRMLVVRFSAADGVERTARVRAENVADRVPPPGGRLPVEYLVSDPARVRPAGAAEANAGDVRFGLVWAGGSAALAVASAVGWVVGGRRHREAGPRRAAPGG